MFEGIRAKFTWTVAAVVTFLFVIFGWFSYVQQKHFLMESVDDQAQQVLNRLRLSLPFPMWNYDEETIIKNIESEMGAKIISRILVVNGTEVIAMRSKSPDGGISDKVEAAVQASSQLTADLIYLKKDAAKIIGKLTIDVDASTVEQALYAAKRDLIIQVVLMNIVVISLIFFLLRRMVLSPLSEINMALGHIAAGGGDLTRRIAVHNNDELSQLAIQVNAFMQKLADIIGNVNETSQQLIESANKSQQFIGNMNDELRGQQQEVEQITCASENLSEYTSQVNNNTIAADDYTTEITATAERGQHTVNGAIDVINGLLVEIDTISGVVKQLELEVSNIGTVSGVIQGIAEQTNLLALNAAIEAARAGESGRGFAVVADEVRSLAQRTQHSTTEINSMIEKLQISSGRVVDIIKKSHEYTSQSVEEIETVGKTINEIVNSIGNISSMNAQIAESSVEQSEVIGELNHNLMSMSNAATRIVELADRTSDVSNESIQHVGTLKVLMEKFKIK